uniref:Glycine-rich protein n=1 Tax=Acrobeloides nanus TaxID=290746 RepID=A0A914EHE9_9BILA
MKITMSIFYTLLLVLSILAINNAIPLKRSNRLSHLRSKRMDTWGNSMSSFSLPDLGFNYIGGVTGFNNGYGPSGYSNYYG